MNIPPEIFGLFIKIQSEADGVNVKCRKREDKGKSEWLLN